MSRLGLATLLLPSAGLKIEMLLATKIIRQAFQLYGRATH